MKTLVVSFLLVAAARGALAQPKRISHFFFVPPSIDCIARSPVNTTPNIGQTIPARPFSSGDAQQLDLKDALIKAVQEKDLAAVKNLLARGANPNGNAQDDRPLTWAGTFEPH